MPDQNGPVAYSLQENEPERKYLFRGDDYCQDGPVGKTIGADADAADIQNLADHVLRKETSRTSRFSSFTTEVKVARRFTSATDNRSVRKVELSLLRALEDQGIVRLWDHDMAYAALKAGPKKLSKQAADVRTAMKRNHEILIEGQIPAELLRTAD